MNCVKCGKETEGTNVFCPECLEAMKRYPVKPGTTVHIPARPEPVERKQTRVRKEKPAEEQLASLQKLVKRLVILAVGLATALAVTLGALAYNLVEPAEPETPQTPMGRNYTTSGSADED